jgi:hypothetical protein
VILRPPETGTGNFFSDYSGGDWLVFVFQKAACPMTGDRKSSQSPALIKKQKGRVSRLHVSLCVLYGEIFLIRIRPLFFHSPN